MPLESILKALEAEAERRVVELEEAAQSEAEQIRAQARAQAAVVRQKHVRASRTLLQVERARIVNRAKLEATRTMMGSREALIASALQAAASRLTALPEREVYPRLLRELAREAVHALGSDVDARLRVHDRDVEVMKHIVSEAGWSAVVEGGLNCLGGLVATDASGRVSVVNTLERRLQRATNLYRRRIAQLVFGD